jgi:hypothetical protein
VFEHEGSSRAARGRAQPHWRKRRDARGVNTRRGSAERGAAVAPSREARTRAAREERLDGAMARRRRISPHSDPGASMAYARQWKAGSGMPAVLVRFGALFVTAALAGCIRPAEAHRDKGEPPCPAPGDEGTRARALGKAPAPRRIAWFARYQPRGGGEAVEREIGEAAGLFPEAANVNGWRCYYEGVETHERRVGRNFGCTRAGSWMRSFVSCSSGPGDEGNEWDRGSLVYGERDDAGNGGQGIVGIDCQAAPTAE